ncbi:30S ribosomal protein S15 [Gracilaria domingensis]|nr:30S ribosomal protein S15 [Gracilaria domingensis]
MRNAASSSTTVLSHEVDAARSRAHEAVAAALSLSNASKSERRRVRKSEIIAQFGRDAQDTGATPVQIALLTDRIKDCTEHVIQNKQDKMSRRRLVMMVAKRRRLMQYLLRTDAQRYMDVITRLGLRPNSVFSRDQPLGARKTAPPRLH